VTTSIEEPRHQEYFLNVSQEKKEKKSKKKFTQVATATTQPQELWWAKLSAPVSIGQQL
jgi:hypothetical protein